MRLEVTVNEENQELVNTKGWFRTAKTRPIWKVILQLHLTEEERSIANKRNLWEREFYLGKLSPEHFENMTPKVRALLGHITDNTTTLQWLVNGYHDKNNPLIREATICYTPLAAKKFEDHFVKDVLPQIKALLADSAEARPGTRSYEA